MASLRTATGKTVLVVGSGSWLEAVPEAIDVSDETQILARVSDELAPAAETDEAAPVLLFAGYRLDLAGQSLVTEAGKDILLTHLEYRLLSEFVRRPGRVLSRDQLLQALSGREAEAYDRSIDVLVGRLRRKIEPDPKHPSLIVAVPGRGYKFTADLKLETTLEEFDKAAPVARHLPGDRRQVTVLSGELLAAAGHVLSEDPEELHPLIESFRMFAAGVCEQFGGSMGQCAGREVTIFFGFPSALEDAAERAIAAGLALAAGPIHVDANRARAVAAGVGIATGLVMVDTSGELIGQVLSEAALLRALAQPGQIILAGATRRLIGALFRLRDLGRQVVLGFAEPIEAWVVEGLAAAETRFEAAHRRLVDLIGRAAECAILRDRLRRAWGGEGQIVLLSGEAGIGKSRLAAQLAAEVAAEPHTRMRFQCSPYHRGSVLHPFVVQLGRAARISAEDAPETQLEKLEAILAPARIGETAPLFASLLSIPTGGRYPPLALSAAQQRRLTLAALLDQLEALARQKPILALFEDAHWADPTSLEVLDLTVERVRALPVLVVITFRPEYEAPWAGLSHATRITLDRLTAAEVESLAMRVAGGLALPREVMAQIVAKTDGVPLFVEELTKAVLESGLLVAEQQGWRLDGPLPPLAIPATLQNSLTARLDRLAPVKEIAQIGALLGREFSYPLLRAVTGRDEAALGAALAQLEEAELLFRAGVPPDARYTFKHALVQDAAYETLLRARRQELHRTAAQTIAAEFPALAEAQPELIARHWSGAGDAERAFAAWRKAGDVARSRNAFIEAREAYRHALDRLATTPPSPGHDTTELELLIATNRMIAATQGSNSPDQVEINARAAALAAKTGNLGHLAEQIYGSWQAAATAGDYPSAMALADRLLDVARRDGGAFTCGLMTYAQLVTRFYIGDLPGAEEHFVAGEGCLSDRGLRRYFVAAWMISIAGWNAWMTGRADEARARMRRAVTTIEDDAFARATVQLASSFLHVFLREPEQAAMLAAQAIATAAGHGFRDIGCWAQMARGWAQAQLGHPEEGASLIGESLTACRANGSRIAVPVFLTLLSEAQALGGAPAESLRTLDEALTVNPDERMWRPETLRLRGDVRRQEGEAELAEADFRDAIALAREMSAKPWELRATTSLARLWCDQGRRGEARDLLVPVYARFSEGFDTPDLKQAKLLLDEL